MDEVTPAKLREWADQLDAYILSSPVVAFLRAEAARRATPKSGEAEVNESERYVSLSLAVKLAAMVVHYGEWQSAKGHAFDAHTIASLRTDPEVAAFMEQAGKTGLLPVKR